MKEIKGSITIEAALMIPLLLFLFAIAMRSGIDLYFEIKETTLVIGEEEKLDVIKKIYQLEELGDVTNDED